MPDPNSNVTEEGDPGDLSGAATDEFGGGGEAVDEGGARDAAVTDIASDDAGGDAMGSNVGRTAGGLADLGVGGQSGPATADGQDAAVIAADDAGAGRRAEQANGSGAD